MFGCPLCNGLKVLSRSCDSCGLTMTDQGRLADYFDDYSPYLDDAIAKLVDGDVDSSKTHTCLHLFRCENCGEEQQFSIEEQALHT